MFMKLKFTLMLLALETMKSVIMKGLMIKSVQSKLKKLIFFSELKKLASKTNKSLKDFDLASANIVYLFYSRYCVCIFKKCYDVWEGSKRIQLFSLICNIKKLLDGFSYVCENLIPDNAFALKIWTNKHLFHHSKKKKLVKRKNNN